MFSGFSRRSFLGLLSAAAVTGTSSVKKSRGAGSLARSSSVSNKPALLGGDPIRTKAFPDWPVIEAHDRDAWKSVLDSKKWNRGPNIEKFESEWASRLGARYSIATSSGTSALYTCLAALGVGPGDEVIVPPYTFVASINVVLLHYALPVFVDTDRDTFQIDPNKIRSAITSNTKCIIPVHLGGNVADLDTILKIGKERQIPVLEDACQAHFAEWRGKRVGALGDLGCFSFQASKNLNSGEGGSITSNNGPLIAQCASFHNAGRAYKIDNQGNLTGDESSGFAYVRNGDNKRMTEFQGALLLEQMQRLEQQAETREKNATYLTQILKDVQGVRPASMYPGCTRNAYHLYMFRYDPQAFAGMPLDKFLAAMRAEGIPCGRGYGPLNKEPFLDVTFKSKGYRKIYSDAELDQLRERNNCPENDLLCEEAVWLTQTQLLGPRTDMDEIAAAIRKVQSFASELV